MPSPETIPIATLLEPIEGPDPAGNPVEFTEFRAQFRELTFENNPDDYPSGTPGSVIGTQKADWRKVIELASKTLKRESKDLEVASRLAQALAQRHKFASESDAISTFAGLRDGLSTLRQLVEQCWDRLHPVLHNGDPADRMIVLSNLLDGNPDNLNSFPEAVRQIPMVKGELGDYGFSHLHGNGRATTDQGDTSQAVARAKLEKCQILAEDVHACLTEANALDQALTAKLPKGSFAMVHLRKALQDCQGTIDAIVQEKGGATATDPSQAGNGTVGATPSAAGGSLASQPRNRDGVFRQLEEAARALEQMEPGSPVPYLIRRAVRLGKLPFPQLIRALLHEQANVHVELDRLLGLADETASPP